MKPLPTAKIKAHQLLGTDSPWLYYRLIISVDGHPDIFQRVEVRAKSELPAIGSPVFIRACKMGFEAV